MKANILIVDDEEGMRFTLKSFLSDEGHNVLTAQSYEEALDILAKTDLDLIFSDIVLGGKTGIDVLRAAKEHNPRCPVVMITGYPDIDTAAEAVRLGAFDYLPKPVVQETLLHTAGLALRYKVLADEREKYRSNMEAVFRSVKDAIVTVDRKLNIIELNEAATTICSLSREAIGGAIDSTPLCCRGKCLTAIREAIEKKEFIEKHRIECGHEEHDSQVVNLSVFPLIDHQGAFSGAVMVVRDETRLATLERDLNERRQFHNMIGKSEVMQKIYGLVESLRDVQTTVLIIGESGTGKELVAEALHCSGARSRKPFVKVNCGALSDSLLESELFGHVKGAFTGAATDKVGRFQKADGGSIFLDEIGNISSRMQLSLLRVLQEREFERVGDSSPIKVDVRVIAATNRDLQDKIRKGEFREDLYYRLKVVQITLPPLRKKREDIPLLVEHFIKKFNEKFNREITAVSEDVLGAFMAYPWPGNVRELEHAIEHGFILCRQSTITLDHLPSELIEFKGPMEKEPSSSPEPSGESDREAILSALQKTGWNKAKAARILGISERTIHRKIKEYNIAETEARGVA